MVNTFTAYEKEAVRTAPPAETPTDMLLLGALGVAGESGEYADLIKKQLYHGHAPDREKALDELGDILWYVAYAARSWMSDLGDVAYRNTMKLRRRYPDQFSSERSIHRVE